MLCACVRVCFCVMDIYIYIYIYRARGRSTTRHARENERHRTDADDVLNRTPQATDQIPRGPLALRRALLAPHGLQQARGGKKASKAPQRSLLTREQATVVQSARVAHLRGVEHVLPAPGGKCSRAH